MSPVNSVAVNFTAQVAVPYVDSGTGSLAQTEDSCRNRESKFSFTLSKTDCEFYQLLLKSVCDDEQPLPEPEFGVQPGSMVQTEDMNPIWISSATAMYMSSLGEEEGNRNLPQQFNSQDSSERDAVEQRVGSFEPNLNHLDHAGLASNGRKHRKPRRTTMEKARSLLDEAGSSIAASIGQKRKDCETRILKEEQEHERKVKKRERDRKYRANLKFWGN
ncbi:uncharacterized protein LOC111284198 isoform X2 [Durio zibethinus]|uniref:Uncharacterized protein LOC111284198 isoform X2 n=1 Tax=Durio zibethinus TaxID=66656 RepID=A0A6P5XKF4_DURZI|nr:uncharacterized protein LOC111284198 isoform X2 [Durio zibethinus]